MITIKAHYDGRAFIPEQPVNLPAGCTVKLAITPPAPEALEDKPLRKLAAIVDQFPSDPDMPTDASMQVDHYLYGLPKRP